MLHWMINSRTGFVVLLVVAFVLALAVYFLPALLAWSMGSPHLVAIAVLDLLLGWTVIGWLASLVWALQTASGETFDEEVPERREPRI